MTLTQNNKRIDWIDMAKGYGMLAVIIAHIVYSGPLHVWIYTFHMPLFFFLSGYVFSNKDNFFAFFKKKVRSLLLPYFSLGIPMMVFTLIYSYFKGSFSIDNTVELIEACLIQKRQWTLWYIACLFFLNILFYVITKFIKHNGFIGVIVGLFAFCGICYYKSGGLALPWNIDVCLTAVPFFFVGYIIKLNFDRLEIIFCKKYVVLLFIVFGLLNVFFGYLNIKTTGKGLEMFYNEYGNPVFTYISAFSGVLAVVIFSSFITLKPIKYIGENSLVYYAWHQTIMIPITKDLFGFLGFSHPTDISQPYYWCYKTIQFAVIIIVLTIPTVIVEKTNLRVLLGKRKINKNI